MVRRPATKPASELGHFEAIDGHSTREIVAGRNSEKALLSGRPGSTVTVSVVRARRAEPQKKATVTRDVVAIPTATES